MKILHLSRFTGTSLSLNQNDLISGDSVKDPLSILEYGKVLANASHFGTQSGGAVLVILPQLAANLLKRSL